MQLPWLSEKSKGQVKVINELPTVLNVKTQVVSEKHENAAGFFHFNMILKDISSQYRSIRA